MGKRNVLIPEELVTDLYEDFTTRDSRSITEAVCYCMNEHFRIIHHEKIVLNEVSKIRIDHLGSILNGIITESVIQNAIGSGRKSTGEIQHSASKKLIKALMIGCYGEHWQKPYLKFYDQKGRLNLKQKKDILRQYNHTNSTLEKPLNLNSIENDYRTFARKIYIELTTRKAAIPIDEEKDVIEEIYNSWYQLFCSIRQELKTLMISNSSRESDSDTITIQANVILNEILRPHLTEHHARFRDWMEKSKMDSKYKKLTPQELQRQYPDYKQLFNSMKSTNDRLAESARTLFELAYNGNQEKK